MNENTNSRELEVDLVFTLDVRVPDKSSTKLKVIDRILAGLDPRNDLILIDPKVKTKHFLFRKRNNILTVHYLGNDGDSSLNGVPLEKGKLYILEKDDILQVGKIEIRILRETGIASAPSLEKEKLEEEFDEEEDEEIPAFTPMPKPKAEDVIIEKAQPQKKVEPHLNLKAIKLIPYKVYGFVIDVALTYLILGFITPSLGLLSPLLDFLYPVTSFLTSNFDFSLKVLSLIEFFICFHFLMIFASLILGTTPGAFLIGLHHTDKDKSLLAIRFKAYLYALLNIVVLPLLIFDIPFYKGKDLKEFLTFSSRDLTSSIFFKITRRAIAPVLIIASFLSPFFLRPPFTATITDDHLRAPKYRDVHTNSLVSSSSTLGISLRSELSNQFALLPYFEKKKLGFVLYDLTNNKALIMKEEQREAMSSALFKLRYANPLASLTIPNEQIANEALKNKTLECLHISLLHIIPGLVDFGPFLSNSFLFKNEFLKNFGLQDNFFINSFDKKNPALRISSGKEEKVFLFTKKEIIEFTLTNPKQTNLLDNLMSGVLAGMYFDQSTSKREGPPQILEVISSFERGNVQTILTYYINEVKKAQTSNNSQWRLFLKKNILQTKQALNGRTTKNIEKSFDDIINSL